MEKRERLDPRTFEIKMNNAENILTHTIKNNSNLQLPTNDKCALLLLS